MLSGDKLASGNAHRVAPVWYRVAIIAFSRLRFLFSTRLPYEIAISVLYVAVVLMSARFLQKRGITFVAAACLVLAVLSSAHFRFGWRGDDAVTGELPRARYVQDSEEANYMG